MPLITLDGASLAFGDAPLLDHADLALDSGERVALIGRNGSGKTTLFKVLADRQALDEGAVWRSPGLRIAFVAQEPPLDPQHTVYEAVAAGLGHLQRTLTEYHKLSQSLTSTTAPSELERLHDLQHELEHGDGWRITSRVDALIDKLGLPADLLVSELSGGMRKRVALAQALALDPEVLLLDEPTNHLDIAAIEWLQELIKSFNGATLFITHDRRFLDEVATRVIELDRGKLSSFPGSFAAYQRRKEEMLNSETLANERFDKLLAQEEVWIRKGVEARRTRNEGRVRRLEALRRERTERRNRVGQVEFAVAQGERSGRLVAELHNVSKSFEPGTPLIDDFSTRIMRGDRIGLIGPNGAGKSTLLKLILGDIEPDSGRIRHGTNLEVAYFDQLREQLDDDATLVDTISKGAEYIEIGGSKKHVMSYLGDFLFRPERARAKVSALSGGERNRLLLARLFSRPANVLVLDEPTNDLDIETLELLEDLLQDYDGTLFLVSHDRAFLDNVVTQVIAFEGGGVLREYVGGYSDWLRQRPASGMQAEPVKTAPSQSASRAKPGESVSRAKPGEPVSRSKPGVSASRAKPMKLTYKEARELEALPGKIEALEREQTQITAKLGDADLYRDDPGEVKALQSRYAAIETELTASLARWEALEAKQAAIETKG
jgi:ATP-binding cassette subfamily F protein uup